MPVDLLETLPLPQRLALSYAPASARPATLALLALDTRLAGVALGGGEPMLVQIKLAWWRDRLGEGPANWPKGEPLLTVLKEAVDDFSGLAALVDGWESLLAEQPTGQEWQEFADGRAALWGALARQFGGSLEDVTRLARTWALSDLTMGMPPGEERTAIAFAARQSLDHPGQSLPRALRPLVVLHALARRSLAHNRSALLDGPGAMLLAIRVGILGR